MTVTVTTMSDAAGSPLMTAIVSSPLHPTPDDVTVTSRRHVTSRRRTSDVTAEDRPRFCVGEDQTPSHRSSRRSTIAVARTAADEEGETGSGSHVTESDAAARSDGSDAEATARRRMTAAERRRLKNELLSSSSLEVSCVLYQSSSQCWTWGGHLYRPNQIQSNPVRQLINPVHSDPIDNSGGASAVKEPGHFEVIKSPIQVRSGHPESLTPRRARLSSVI